MAYKTQRDQYITNVHDVRVLVAGPTYDALRVFWEDSQDEIEIVVRHIEIENETRFYGRYRSVHVPLRGGVGTVVGFVRVD